MLGLVFPGKNVTSSTNTHKTQPDQAHSEVEVVCHAGSGNLGDNNLNNNNNGSNNAGASNEGNFNIGQSAHNSLWVPALQSC